MIKMGNYAIYCKNVDELKKVMKKFKFISESLGVESHWSSGNHVEDCIWLYNNCPLWIYFKCTDNDIVLTWEDGLLDPAFEVIDTGVFLNYDNSITIYRLGKKVVAVDNNTGYKEQIFLSSFEEGNDFPSVSKTLIDRLFLKLGAHKDTTEPEPIPYLSGEDSHFCGTIGEPTNLTDSFGRKLFVGDVVEVISHYGSEDWNEFVLYDSSSNKYFIKSIKGFCVGGNDYCNSYLVVKVKDYSDLEHLESYSKIKAILK